MSGAAPAPAYLVAGGDASLVVDELAALLARLTATGTDAGGRDPVLVKEYGPLTTGRDRDPGASGSTMETAAGDDAGAGGGDGGTGAGAGGGAGGRGRIELGPVLEACTTTPMFADRRVVVLRHAGLLDSAQVKSIVGYLADPLPTTSLVLVADDKPVAAALAKAVRGAGEVIDTTVPAGARGRASWLDARLRRAPVRLAPEARALLQDNLGDDLARLPGLLAELSAAYGDGARIGPDELSAFLGEAGALAPWDLTDAIDAGDGDRALQVLQRMLSSGDRHALTVLATLHRHYGAMLRLDGAGAGGEGDAAAMLGMKPFPAGKALREGKALGHERISRAICLLADADLDVRGRSGLPPDAVIEVLVARLTQLARAAHGRPGARRQQVTGGRGSR